MNGAEAFIETLARQGVRACFANPGTSEMQLVAALDGQQTLRAVLGLFEGVVTGAADGYGRMADAPALTLLHLGPGLGNGLANLHNARRARTPVINVVGDHAVAHLPLDAPLTSDVAGVARPMSDWVRTAASPDDLARAGSEAIAASRDYPGRIATVIAPADHAWNAASAPAGPVAAPPVRRADDDTVRAAADALRRGSAGCLFLGGRALREDALEAAGRIRAATGARLVCETFPARLQRGAGRVDVERLPYFGEAAAASLAELDTVILAGAPAPVSFFAYPGKPSELLPRAAAVVTLADPRTDAADALLRLADALDAPAAVTVERAGADAVADGPLTPQSAAAVLAALMPDDAIVSDEGATSGLPAFVATATSAPHDWLTLTGGSIGQGLPVAVGAAVACPDRKVIALQADGGGMYTVQALWTMAREALDVTTVVFNNGSYAILNIELARVGVTEPGDTARDLLDLTRPSIDWVALSGALGVPAVRAGTVDEFRTALGNALAATGPRLIEAVVPARP